MQVLRNSRKIIKQYSANKENLPQWLYKKEIQAVSIPKYYLDFAEYNEGKLDKIAIFFMNLKNDVREKVEDMFREMIAGPGAVRATIHKYVG